MRNKCKYCGESISDKYEYCSKDCMVRHAHRNDGYLSEEKQKNIEKLRNIESDGIGF